MKLFLDVCCLNRPFDDQRQHRIHLESEAVILVLADVRNGQHEMIRSDSLELEIAKNPDVERRDRVNHLLNLAEHYVTMAEQEAARARELFELGFGAYDALHLACAESAGAGVFLTTDDGLLRRARRHAAALRVRVTNPLQWLTEDES